jgi:hypothetical protein
MASRIILLVLLTACSAGLRRFPMQPPYTHDTDTRPIRPPCDDPQHCMPAPYLSPLTWDAVDKTIFRPITRFFAVSPGGEAVDVNSLDEVPDSAWYENHDVDDAEVASGPCTGADPDPDAPAGTWLIDKGKPNGDTPGFRVKLPDGRRFMFKIDLAKSAERSNAASVIGARLYHAVGFAVPCERVLEVDPAVFTLQPGLTVTSNANVTRPFDQALLAEVLADGQHVGKRVRIEASEWLPGIPLGPFRYTGTRSDDPNDIIPHEDRRELRGARLIAAWLNHFDAREQNTLDTWIAASDTTGYIRHFYLDFSDSLGSAWEIRGIAIRLGFSYYLDFEHIAEDFLSFGLIERPWDRVIENPDAPIFHYYSDRDFDPETWHVGYPNPAFDRMTERDAAWMARKIARISPSEIHSLVAHGRLAPQYATVLEHTLIARQQIILRRYLGHLSPLADVTTTNDTICAIDLAHQSGAFDQPFTYTASEGTITTSNDQVCVHLEHRDFPNLPDSDPRRYRVITVHDSIAPGPLEIHLYDLGPNRPYFLAGLVRPEP